MRDDELLELWTRAGGSAPDARGRVLAGMLSSVPDPGDAPIGDLNRALLDAWRTQFGDRMDCVTACAACGERLEFELSAEAILAAGAPAGPAPVVEHGGRRLPLRMPTPCDLDAVAGAGSATLARRELARRCARVDDEGEEVDALADAVSRALEAADPHIAVGLVLTCPACDARFRATVDVGAHVWAAVDSRARRVIAEVAELAAAYGWTEDEVLRLPGARRRAYAERAAR